MRVTGGPALPRDASPPLPPPSASSSSPPPCLSSYASCSLPSSPLLLLPGPSSSPPPQPLPPPSLPVLSLPGDSEKTDRGGVGGAFVDDLFGKVEDDDLLIRECGRAEDWPRSSAGVVKEVVRVCDKRGVTSFSPCEGVRLQSAAFSPEGFRQPSSWDTLFPEAVEKAGERRPEDVAGGIPQKASSSSWSAAACGSCGRDATWKPPASSSRGHSSSSRGDSSSSRGDSAPQRRPPSWKSWSSSSSFKVRGRPGGGGRGQGHPHPPGGGMLSSLGSLRRCRQWLGVGLPVTVLVYVALWCHSLLWGSLYLQHAPSLNTLPGSGFRKLLEEQERGRLWVNVSVAGLAQRLPSCIIIGVRKCGTRALLEFLDLHPDIVTAGDEVHFFNDDERYRLGLEWYRRLMPPSRPGQITLEKTPGYFISPIAPSRVHRMSSAVKLLVLLRHPTTRTVSDYTQIFYNKLSKNESLGSFESLALDRDTGGVNTRYKAVQISMYHRHFRHWTDVFPLRQIHVVDGDRLITDPVSEIREIESFLGLEHRIDYSLLYFNSTRGFYCMHINATHEKCLGASKGRKHPDIQVSVIRKMNRFFQPHNRELFQLIDRKFPWS